MAKMRVAFLGVVAWVAAVGGAAAQVPQFRDFTVPVFTGPNAPVRLVTPGDKMFRTRLSEGSKQPVNFAGHYILTTWGCGTSCETGSVIDARTGQVIDLPGSICCEPPEAVDDKFERIIARRDSRLLVLSGRINESGEQGAHFYLLESGRFIHLADAPFKTRESMPPTQSSVQHPSSQTADKPAVSAEADQSRKAAVINDLSRCFAREYPLNRYTSLDGGHSSLVLLSKCGDQWSAASRQCQVDDGGSERDCNLQTGMLAQLFLKLKEAGSR